tara:strand:+ start:39 stop:593 length:555 start_codon:yes stop_codon:yes gene_type:complete
MNVILGLDVSTSKVGLSIINYDGKLLECQVVKLDSKQPLEDRCLELERVINKYNVLNYINNHTVPYNIKEVYIEQAFIMFSGGKTTAMTMSKLQRFNGMCSFMVRRLFGFNPVLIAANRARSINGIKIKRGENTKKKVIEWVAAKYPKDFLVELTRYGNPKSGTDDMADAVVVALAGLNGGENG